jgi:pyruvate oxidase
MDTIADYIAQDLVDHGITHVFGYPGASILPLMHAIVKHPDLEWVLMRNEASAALAAGAQAKLTGGLACCLATSGPGATNLVTGLVDAQVDSAAVVALTGMLPTWWQGRLDFQDIDSARLLDPLVGLSGHCTHPNELAAMLREAMAHALEQHCVAHLAIPTDIQQLAIDDRNRSFFVPVAPQPATALFPTEAAFDEAVKTLGEAEHVAIVVGTAARNCGAEIMALAEALGAPVVTTLGGKGAVDERHPNAAGVMGIFGAPGEEVAREVLARANLVLTFGVAHLWPYVAGRSGRQERTLVRCHPSPRHIPGGFRATPSLIGPLDRIADELRNRIAGPGNHLCLEHAHATMKEFLEHWEDDRLPQDAAYVHPVRLMRALSAHLREDAAVTLDIGDNAVWTAQFLTMKGGRAAVVSDNLGVMGAALPAAMAAAITLPGSPVLAIAGDGGVQMTIGEIGAAAQQGLSLVLVILNNGLLGRIGAQESEPYSVELANPDFVALARAYGADGLRLDGNTDLNAAIEQAFAHRGSPFVLDVICDPEVLAPMSGWNDDFVPLHFS